MTRLRQFRVLVAGEPTDEQVEALLVRHDDVSIEVCPASAEALVAFDREAPTLVDAIVSGIHDLDHAGMTAAEVRDDDDVVTLGVIAQRTVRAETAVWRWTTGEAGPGGFPAPLFEHPRRPCYLWSAVAPWLRVHYGHEPPDVADTLRAVNLALQLRGLSKRVERIAALHGLFAADP